MKRPLLWVIDHPLLAVTNRDYHGLLRAPDWPAPDRHLHRKLHDGEGPGATVLRAVPPELQADTLTDHPGKSGRRLHSAGPRGHSAAFRYPRAPDGVSRVESLTTLRNIKGEGDSITTEPLVPASIPTAQADLERIREDALDHRVLVGNIVSNDSKATAIIIHTDPAPADKRFNKRFSSDVEALIKQESASGLTVYQFGMPLLDATVGEFILQDLLMSVPLSLAVLFLLLFVAFGTLQGVVIPLVTGILSTVWGLGLMALFGLPINILTATIPSLIMVIGSAEDVHMISDYYHRLEGGNTKLVALRTAIQLWRRCRSSSLPPRRSSASRAWPSATSPCSSSSATPARWRWWPTSS